MKNKQQFKIETVEELEQAYNELKDEWSNFWDLEREIRIFNDDNNYRYVRKTDCGNYMLNHFNDEYEEISNPFKNQFKEGEVIEVSDNEKNWSERIFLHKFKNAFCPFACVSSDFENKYKNNQRYTIVCWVYARKKQDVKIIINNEEKSPHDFTKKEWTKLRK